MLEFSIVAAQFVIGLIMFAIGATVFSFLNVVIYRLPYGLSFNVGHSMCKSCGHELSMKDMMPVLAWFYLGGKCRYCKAKFSIRYSLVEALGGAIAVFLTMYCGFTLKALTIFLFFCVLTVITFIDMDTMEIPTELNVIIFVLGVISIWTIGGVDIVSRVIGMFVISVPMLLIAIIVPGGFGGGDIKMMFAAGFLLGFKSSIAAFVIALYLGGFYAIYLLICLKKGKKHHFAFGPFLCMGMAIAIFAGEWLVNFYIQYIFNGLI